MILKRYVLTMLLVSTVFFLAGCVAMMPIVMGSMLKKNTDKFMQSETESIMYK